MTISYFDPQTFDRSKKEHRDLWWLHEEHNQRNNQYHLWSELPPTYFVDIDPATIDPNDKEIARIIFIMEDTVVTAFYKKSPSNTPERLITRIHAFFHKDTAVKLTDALDLSNVPEEQRNPIKSLIKGE